MPPTLHPGGAFVPRSGGTMTGDLSMNGLALTAGTLTYDSVALARRTLHKFSWTNAMVVAAASSSNKIDVATLPSKTVVHGCWVVIGTAATQAATLTVQAGTSADTDGYVVASNAKAAANTFYGDATAEQGVLLFSTNHLHPVNYTATTLVQIEFVIGAGTLADVVASTGTVFLDVSILP